MNCTTPNPKEFYDTVMPGKLGADYEGARWLKTPLLRAQYAMTAQTIREHVAPASRNAKRIIEVGPGPGTWTALLLAANDVASYTLVDISREMLSLARGRFSQRSNVSFVESDFLSFESEQTYGYFFSSRAIEYMPDKRRACQKIANLLAPGARGAIVTKMPKPLFDRLRGRFVMPLHGAQIAPRALVRFLRESGLVVDGVRLATATVPLIGSALLNMLAYRFLKHVPLFVPLSLFAESYIVTFKKPLWSSN